MTTDRGQPREQDSADGLPQVVGTGLVLALFLVDMRWRAAGFTWRQVTHLAGVRELVMLAYYDVVYVAVASGAFIGALRVARGRPRVERILGWLNIALAIFSLVMAYVNEKALRELGSPLTY